VRLREPEITFVFSFDPGLETLGGVFPLPEQFFNPRESAARGSGARSDSFISAVEVVPGQRLHVGPKHEVGVAFPDFELVLLRRVHGPAYNLENVRGGAAVAVQHADGDTNYRSGSEVAGGARWNRRDEPTVSKTPCADHDRFEQAREGAARADGVHKIALREHDGFAGSQVRGYYRKRNAEIFKLARFENAFDQILKTLIACQAEPGDAPTGDIPEAQGTAGLNDARKRRATGVGSAQDAAHAGSRDVRDGDVVLFEDLQNAEMREAARETSAKREADACPVGHGDCTFVQDFARSVPVPRHTSRIAGKTSSSYGSRVPKKQYFCTPMEIARESMLASLPVPSY
jgi:hypothetical protein